MSGKHNLKAGFYYERTGKVQYNGTGNYLGNYNFAGGNANMAADTQDGYANAWLGNFQQYSEGSRAIGDYWFTGIEAFLQDNWRVSRRVTLDLGVRFYRLEPQQNLNSTSAAFIRSTYNAAAAGRIYYPSCAVYSVNGNCSAPTRAYDPATGAYASTTFIGTIVPQSAGGYSATLDPFTGMQKMTANNPNVPFSGFTVPAFSPAFRIGFAWDPFGNGKTAIRGGFGQFLNRGDGNQIMDTMGGQPPVNINKSIYFTNIASIPGLASSAAISPIGPGEIIGSQKYEGAYNGSFMIQQNVGFGTVLEASWVFNLRKHIMQTRNINYTAQWANYTHPDPTKAYLDQYYPGGNASGRSIADNYYRPIQGYAGLQQRNFDGSSNYHSLQVVVRRNMTKRLSYGLSYNWSKLMSGGPSDYFTVQFRNWGPSYQPTPHALSLNYVYQVPDLAKKLHFKPLGWITDNWQVSGITQWRSNMVTGISGVPGFNGQNGSNNPGPNYTGSSSEGARAVITGNPNIPSSELSFVGGPQTTIGLQGTSGNRIININYVMPPNPCSLTPQATPLQGIGENMACFGNAGPGSLVTVPHTRVNNWDITFQKAFPLKSEKRSLTFQLQAYNIFNHTQFSGFSLGQTFEWNNYKNGVLVEQNGGTNRYTSSLNPRQMSMNLRFQF